MNPWNAKSRKTELLWAVTALVLVYVRRALEKTPSSMDMAVFLGSWVVHFFGIAFLSFICWAVIKKVEPFFFGYVDFDQGLSIDKAAIYIPLVILITSICIWIIAHFPVGFNEFGFE